MARRTFDLNTRPLLQRPDLRPRVLLVDADRSVRAVWAEHIGNACVVVEAESSDGLQSAIAEAPVDVVVSRWNEALWQALDRMGWPSNYLHVGSTLPAALIDAAGLSLPVASIAHDGELQAKVLAAARVHQQRAIRHLPSGVTLRFGNSPVDFDVLDLSNLGAAFAVPLDSEIKAFLPGTLLPNVTLRRGGGLVLERASLRVRNLSLDYDRYRVGGDFPPLRMTSAFDSSGLVSDRVQIAALLSQAAEGGGISLERPDRTVIVTDARGTLDSASRTVSCDVSRDDLFELEFVRGRFEMAGHLYQFVAAVVSTSPLTFQLPTRIEERRRRSVFRHRFEASATVMLKVLTSLNEQEFEARALDLSANGVSFSIEPTKVLLPVGLMMPRLRVFFGDGGKEVVCTGRVRNVSPTDGSGRARCGVEFEEISEEARHRLTAFVVQQRLPSATDGAGTPFEPLWRLFADGGLISEHWQRQMQNRLVEVRSTFDRLYAKPSSVFRSVVVRDGDALMGHISAARIYQRTWVLQHLVATGAGDESYVLNMACAEYLSQLSNFEYFHLAFLADNKWPAGVFGGFVRRLRDSDESDARGMYPIVVRCDERLADPSGRADEFEVTPATRADLIAVQAYFVANERLVILQANDLTLEGLELGEIDRCYREVGLSRRRRIFIARHRGARVGFAMLELSSPGLNLQEQFSSVQVRAFERTEEALLQPLRVALLRAVGQVCLADGRAFVRGFIRRTEVEDYLALGMPSVGRVIFWTCRRTHFRRFSEHVERCFRTLIARQRRLKTRVARTSGS